MCFSQWAGGVGKHMTLHILGSNTLKKKTKTTHWQMIKETVYKIRKKQQKGSFSLQIGPSIHGVCSNLSLWALESWWASLLPFRQRESLLFHIADQNTHKHMWAILKMKNIQCWKETEVISLLKIIMHINYTAVTGIHLLNLRKASAFPVESINFSFPNLWVIA